MKLKKYGVGTPLKIYYDDQDPQKSVVLKSELDDTDLLTVNIVSGLVFCSGIIFLIFAIKKDNDEKRSASM